jgi:hypothetical protein
MYIRSRLIYGFIYERVCDYIYKGFCDLYSLPSIIRIIKSRTMRLAGHVARMGENRNAYRLLE